jgi:hypothetical protein
LFLQLDRDRRSADYPWSATTSTHRPARAMNIAERLNLRGATQAALVPLLLIAACEQGTDLSLPAPVAIEVPAGTGSAQPFAASRGNTVILSWTEAVTGGHTLRFAEFDGENWAEPRTVTEGANWFVNWADFPSVVALDDERYAAHWLQRSGPGRYAYDVVIATSGDGGATWSTPTRPHRDGTETEHGFVSLFPLGSGAAAVWLDGRTFAEAADAPAVKEMQLRFATLEHHRDAAEASHASGLTVAGAEELLDARICDCCQTAVALPSSGPVVFYRDRSPGEVRDISYTRMVGNQWSTPRPIHEDGWVINACPVNGPAADADGDHVVVAWFTGASDTPRVRVAFSTDGAATFGPPIPVDDGQPIGRVDVLFLRNGAALVVWIERVGEDAEIRGRVVDRDGARGESAALTTTTAGRSGGFPRMARMGDDVFLAWTEPGEASRIRAAVLPFGAR